MNPYSDAQDMTDTYVHIFAAMSGQRAFRRHPSHVWEFGPQLKRRAGYTKNKRQGTSKPVRKMQDRSRKINRHK